MKSLRHSILASCLSLFLIPTTIALEPLMTDRFDADPQLRWSYVSDQVMGGVSEGRLAFKEEGGEQFAHMTGQVSTENNGGFIQLRAGISFANTQTLGQSISGARLTARGNGEVYHVFIRTKDTRSYSDYYYATFIASKDWQIIDLPFKDFKRSRSTGSLLLAKDIVRFAIVGYGRDFDADVSVSNITFYY